MKNKIIAILSIIVLNALLVGCTRKHNYSESVVRGDQFDVIDSQIKKHFKGYYNKDCIGSVCTCYDTYTHCMITCDFYDAIKLE